MTLQDHFNENRRAAKRAQREDQYNRAYTDDINEHEAAEIVSDICQQAQQRDKEEN